MKWLGGVDEFLANGGSGVFTEAHSGLTGTHDVDIQEYFIIGNVKSSKAKKKKKKNLHNDMTLKTGFR